MISLKDRYDIIDDEALELRKEDVRRKAAAYPDSAYPFIKRFRDSGIDTSTYPDVRRLAAEDIFGKSMELRKAEKCSEDEAVIHRSTLYSGISPFTPVSGHDFFIEGNGLTYLTDYEQIRDPVRRYKDIPKIPVPFGYKSLLICERLEIFENGEIIYHKPCPAPFDQNDLPECSPHYYICSQSVNHFYRYDFGDIIKTAGLGFKAEAFDEYEEAAIYFSKRYGVKTLVSRVLEWINWH